MAAAATPAPAPHAAAAHPIAARRRARPGVSKPCGNSSMMNSAAAARAASLDLGIRLASGRPHPDIGADRIVEQQRVLPHIGDRVSQARQRHSRGCPSPVDRDAARSRTSPRRGISDNAVLLPAPDGPTSATVSPGAASKLRSFSPTRPSGYAYDTPSNRTRPGPGGNATGPGSLPHHRLLVDDVEHARQPGHPLLQRRIQRPQRPQWL